MQKKNSFAQQQKDLDESYKDSLHNKKEREYMEVKDIMKRLNNLANAVNDATDHGMKQIWTDKWYALVKQYAQAIKQKENLK
jgi:plasmid replication initiation protein